MKHRMTLADYGYPAEGIIEICPDGGPDGYEAPQEILSPHTCASCRKYDDACTKEWNNCDEAYYVPERDDRDPDVDTCDDIDYREEWLDASYGFRDPVRCEYSSDETFQQACKAIARINADINSEHEERSEMQ